MHSGSDFRHFRNVRGHPAFRERFVIVSQSVRPKSLVSKECPACGNPEVREWMRAPDRFHGRSEIYVLVRCQSCSLVWTDNPPRPEEMGIHYSSDYDRLIALAGDGSPGHSDGRGNVVRRYKQQGRLLDLGCSSGAFLTAMKGPS